ncbi:MAG: DUF928 domain-containing protein [Leptolyngbya sp. SIO3F4]|nr:DUF928 domain-containing protein [Leptolyngbya sp. SIO3F4]
MRSQKLLAPISLTLAVLLSQFGVIPLASAIPNPIDNGKQETLPRVPTTPPPQETGRTGNRTPGGGLDGEQSVCPAKNQELTAITPSTVYGKTLSAHPTFWFYMPYTADEVEQGEFTILTEDEFERVYQTSFKLPERPGFVSITLPMAESSGLEMGKDYHWYLELSCIADEESKTDLNIDGWVQRISSTPELENKVINLSPEVWYDSFDYLAKQLQSGAGFGQAWVDVLQSVELEQFTQEPLVGPVMLTDG